MLRVQLMMEMGRRAQPEYACFNCDHAGGGLYRAHQGETSWWLGLEANGQANYACDYCKDALFNVKRVRELTPNVGKD